MVCEVTVIALAFYQSCFLLSPNLFHCLLYIFENSFIFRTSVTLLPLSQVIFLLLDYFWCRISLGEVTSQCEKKLVVLCKMESGISHDFE